MEVSMLNASIIKIMLSRLEDNVLIHIISVKGLTVVSLHTLAYSIRAKTHTVYSQPEK